MNARDEILSLEHTFWQALVDMDLDVVISLLDKRSLSVSSYGIGHFTPEQYRQMAASGDARVTAFDFSDEQVVFPIDDVAIASYKAKQTFTSGGKSHDTVVYNTTTWVRKGGRWLASAHTETPSN